jgi:hypothetical protein
MQSRSGVLPALSRWSAEPDYAALIERDVADAKPTLPMDSPLGDTLQESDGMIPSVAKCRNIASTPWGGSFAPPSSHQVNTAM